MSARVLHSSSTPSLVVCVPWPWDYRSLGLRIAHQARVMSGRLESSFLLPQAAEWGKQPQPQGPEGPVTRKSLLGTPAASGFLEPGSTLL